MKKDKIFKEELTEWSDGTLNHTYIFDKKTKWLIGYIKNGEVKETYFTLPIKTFSTKNRKFKDVTKEYYERKTEWDW